MAYKLEYLDQLVKATTAGGKPTEFTLSEMDRVQILHETLQETEKIKVLLVQYKCIGPGMATVSSSIASSRSSGFSTNGSYRSSIVCAFDKRLICL
ncbi:MAG: hypothetical protein ABIQ31_05535 [Ferruginibacter sp.]